MKKVALLAALLLAIGGVAKAQSYPSPTFNNLTASTSNGVYNAAACAQNSGAPSWCSGSDIAAWINAAQAAGAAAAGGNLDASVDIVLPPGQTYTATTPINLRENTKLYCSGSTIVNAQPSGAVVAIHTPRSVANSIIRPVLEDCQITCGTGSGWQAGNTNIGIFLGGDPLGVISPVNDQASMLSLTDNVVQGCYQDITWGNNAWSVDFDGLQLHGGTYDGIYGPPQAVAASVTSFSIASNVVIINASNSYAAGQTFFVTGLSTGTYLNYIPLVVASATSSTVTASFTHADVGSTADGGTIYEGGVENSGELFHFRNLGVFNVLHCGIDSQSVLNELSVSDSSEDFNANAVCGAGVWLKGLNNHFEQNSGYFFNMPGTANKLILTDFGSSFTLDNKTGTDQGLIANARSTSAVVLNSPVLEMQHALNYFVYTGTASTYVACVQNPVQLGTAAIPTHATDASANSGCTTIP